jgi:hypothetical protein
LPHSWSFSSGCQGGDEELIVFPCVYLPTGWPTSPQHFLWLVFLFSWPCVWLLSIRSDSVIRFVSVGVALRLNIPVQCDEVLGARRQSSNTLRASSVTVSGTAADWWVYVIQCYIKLAIH